MSTICTNTVASDHRKCFGLAEACRYTAGVADWMPLHTTQSTHMGHHTLIVRWLIVICTPRHTHTRSQQLKLQSFIQHDTFEREKRERETNGSNSFVCLPPQPQQSLHTVCFARTYVEAFSNCSTQFVL